MNSVAEAIKTATRHVGLPLTWYRIRGKKKAEPQQIYQSGHISTRDNKSYRIGWVDDVAVQPLPWNFEIANELAPLPDPKWTSAPLRMAWAESALNGYG